jgi:hypothetical protein
MNGSANAALKTAACLLMASCRSFPAAPRLPVYRNAVIRTESKMLTQFGAVGDKGRTSRNARALHIARRSKANSFGYLRKLRCDDMKCSETSSKNVVNEFYFSSN